MKHQSYVDRLLMTDEEIRALEQAEDSKLKRELEAARDERYRSILLGEQRLEPEQKSKLLPFVGGIPLANLEGLFGAVADLIDEAISEDRKRRAEK